MAEAASLSPAAPLRRILGDATRLRCPGAGSCFRAQCAVFPVWLSDARDWQSGLLLGDLGVVVHAMRRATVAFFQAEADERNAAAGLEEADRPDWEALLRGRWRVAREPRPFRPLWPPAGGADPPGAEPGRPVRVGDLLAAAGDSTRGTRTRVKLDRAARRDNPGGEDVFALLREWDGRCAAFPDDPAPVVAGVHLRRIARAMRRATAQRFQEEADERNAARGTTEPDRTDWATLFARWERPLRARVADGRPATPGPAPAAHPLARVAGGVHPLRLVA